MMQPISRKRNLAIMLSSEQPMRASKISRICSSLPARMSEHDSDRNPQQHLMGIIDSHGVGVEIKDALHIQDFFSEYSEDELNGYNSEVLNAIRNQDIAKLKELHESGRPLNCSNTFGESLIHMACRRGFFDVVSFLVHEAKVPVQVRDDYGRTILHDAAWTCEPDFQLVELILTECPDLLYMRDRRGDTPLAYARKSHWPAWNKFLSENVHLIFPSTCAMKCVQ
jgi:hypothetical protein